MIGNPLASIVKVCKGWDIPIANSHGHENTSIGKGSEHIRVGVKDFDTVKDGPSFDKVGNLSWWWEVISIGAIIYAYGA